MPGYTHLQRAQPVLFAHHVLAYFEMFGRDDRRFRQAYESADVLPLGSGALAGVPYPIDRESVAEELGFGAVSSNSMDAVADRDFILDFQSAAAICMVHVSRLAARAGHLVLRGVRLRPARRRVHHRQQHHAPEAQSRRGGAGQGEVG